MQVIMEAPLLVSSGAEFWCPQWTTEQEGTKTCNDPAIETKTTLARELLYFRILYTWPKFTITNWTLKKEKFKQIQCINEVHLIKRNWIIVRFIDSLGFRMSISEWFISILQNIIRESRVPICMLNAHIK